MFASPEEKKKVEFGGIGQIDAKTFKAIHVVASRIKKLSQNEQN
jgi:hypothetical protein